MILSLATSRSLAAQTAPAAAVAPAAAAPAAIADSPDASETRMRVQQILRALPPALGEVLRHDPSLRTRADCLAPYPRLVAFLQQHPDVARNPAFYLLLANAALAVADRLANAVPAGGY